MQRPTLAELADPVYDLLIVGGGIIGCGVARDAALRGLRVALVERDDFGSGTTSRSTRLIHGGLRYLELFDFGLVREDMREREILLRNAPHLVHPLPFLVPMYRPSVLARARMRAGMVLYDVLSFDKRLPNHHFLTREETLAAEPELDPDGLEGAASYFDAQAEFPERLCVENILDAAAHGAILRNHTSVEQFALRDGAVIGAEVRDILTGEQATIRARLTLNATGAWLDRTLGPLRGAERPLLRTTKGVHLVTPRLGPNAVVLFARSDGRLFFVVPWHGLSLIGTTDTDEPNPPEKARADRGDVAYLIDETRRAFPRLTTLQPYYSMAGVRALVRRDSVHESQVSRKHTVLDHSKEGGPQALVSVVGGKITGYRAIAEDAADLAAAKLGIRVRSSTAARPLPGAPRDRKRLELDLENGGEALGLSAAQCQYLYAQYGSRAPAVLELAREQPELASQADPVQPTLLAEAVHAVRSEGAVRLIDVMLRRTPLGFAPDQGRGAAPRVAEVLGQTLGWSVDRTTAELAEYERYLDAQYSLEPSLGPTART